MWRHDALSTISSGVVKNEKVLNDTEVFLFLFDITSIVFDCLTFDVGRGLRLQLGQGHAKFDSYQKGKLEDGASGSNSMICQIKETKRLVWEGLDDLEFNLYRTHYIFPSTRIGGAKLSLKAIYKELVTVAKSCSPGDHASSMELEVNCHTGQRTFAGKINLTVSCKMRHLETLGGRKALKNTSAGTFEPQETIYSRDIEKKAKQIHEAKKLQENLSKAQTELWMLGLKTLKERGLEIPHGQGTESDRATMLRSILGLRRGFSFTHSSTNPAPGGHLSVPVSRPVMLLQPKKPLEQIKEFESLHAGGVALPVYTREVSVDISHLDSLKISRGVSA
jgi:hypothetical protein